MLVWVDVSSFPRGLFSGFRRSFFGVCSIHRNHPEMVWHCEEGPTPAPSTFGWTCWAFCLCRWITLSSGQLRKMHDAINRAESAVFLKRWKPETGLGLHSTWHVSCWYLSCFLCVCNNLLLYAASSKSPPFPSRDGINELRWWMLSRMAWTATPLSWERLADPFIVGGTGWAWKPRSSSDIPMVLGDCFSGDGNIFLGSMMPNDRHGCRLTLWKLETTGSTFGRNWWSLILSCGLKQHVKMPISSSTKHNQCI